MKTNVIAATFIDGIAAHDYEHVARFCGKHLLLFYTRKESGFSEENPHFSIIAIVDKMELRKMVDADIEEYKKKYKNLPLSEANQLEESMCNLWSVIHNNCKNIEITELALNYKDYSPIYQFVKD